ncbi:MAG: MBL fold metallo-hydrolase [Chthoniobacterales bacterium]
MKLTNFGGATAILEHNGVRILFDPWLDDGIFHGSWYHYPPIAVDISDIGHVDYIYISHIHEDHCSAGTLRHLNRDAEIILVDRNPNFVARFLEANGFHFRAVHLIKPRAEKELRPGLVAGMLEPDPGNEMSHIIDSALLLRWDGFTVYNANDCQPYEDGINFVREKFGVVDLALLPYSGGSGYPSCYSNLSDEHKIAEKQRIQKSRIGNFVATVRKLDARFVVPFADQYVVAGSRSHLNRFISHPACPRVAGDALKAEGLGDRLVLLNSGQSFDFGSRLKSPDEPYKFFSEEDRERHVERFLLDKPYDHERFTFGTGIAVDRLISHARMRLWASQQRRHFTPAFSLYLEVEDQKKRYRIQLDRENVTEVAWDAPLEEPYLRVGCGYTLMIMLLLGHVSWNIADASLFLDYHRAPNDYDPEIYVCLNLLKV